MRQKIPMNEREMNGITFLFELSVSVFSGKKTRLKSMDISVYMTLPTKQTT